MKLDFSSVYIRVFFSSLFLSPFFIQTSVHILLCSTASSFQHPDFVLQGFTSTAVWYSSPLILLPSPPSRCVLSRDRLRVGCRGDFTLHFLARLTMDVRPRRSGPCVWAPSQIVIVLLPTAFVWDPVKMGCCSARCTLVLLCCLQLVSDCCFFLSSSSFDSHDDAT